MASQKGMACIAALALLAFVCHAAMGSDENDNRTTTHAITVNAASLPDFDGDGTVGFSDFVIFAQNFGKEVPSPVVAIPDANLWVAIEDALGKASAAPITQARDGDIGSSLGRETVHQRWANFILPALSPLGIQQRQRHPWRI